MQITEEQIRREAAECDARKVRQAQLMSPFEKFMAGADLFEDACKTTLSGIRHQYPQWTEDECRAHLKQRVSETRTSV